MKRLLIVAALAAALPALAACETEQPEIDRNNMVEDTRPCGPGTDRVCP